MIVIALKLNLQRQNPELAFFSPDVPPLLYSLTILAPSADTLPSQLLRKHNSDACQQD